MTTESRLRTVSSETIFSTAKPVIAMIHAGALPGTPASRATLRELEAQAVAEARIYRAAGVHGLMLENMHDVPYLRGSVGPEITDVSVATVRWYRVPGCDTGGVAIWMTAGWPAHPVPVRTPVEFVPQCDARFVSSAVPSGGEAFDSGLLRPGERFRFVPGVQGTWEFVDQVSGAFGTLTVGFESVAGAYDRVSPSFLNYPQRYVMHDDSTFALEYGSPTRFAFPGWYSRADSVVSFRFQGLNTAGAWLAEGILRGDSLIVAYNLVMLLADFEDGVYVRLGSD